MKKVAMECYYEGEPEMRGFMKGWKIGMIKDYLKYRSEASEIKSG